MRRSAAPSQTTGNVPLVKRQKFVPPSSTKPVSFVRPENTVHHVPMQQINSLEPGHADKKTKLSFSPPSSTGRTPQLFNNVVCKNEEFGQIRKTGSPQFVQNSLKCLSRKEFIPPSLGSKKNSTLEIEPSSKIIESRNTPYPLSPLTPNTEADPPAGSASSTLYFNVMWCKMSKKKHKKWEGDAILLTSGRTATLYDMEGKIIGKGSGYKTTDLQLLKEDETLFVGGKEIQVMSKLLERDFKSGKCFTADFSSCDSSAPCVETKRNSAASKPFTNPVLKSGSSLSNKSVSGGPTNVPSSGPKHDPLAPGALVMPRPSQQHQWRYNKSGAPVVDVVIDPYLSTCLRQHQREGVIFLYECIMGFRDYQGHGAILADDMGLGKTLQCISLLWTLLKQGPFGGKPVVKKALVITPGSLVKNWYQEFKKWLGTERLSVYAVSGDKRAEEFVKSNVYPVLVISYEMFVRSYDTIKDVQFDIIICDEGHRLKNTAIKTTSLIMSLPCRRRVLLTGTPVQNDLQEFFAIVEFCNPGILGSSTAFKKVYEEPIVASRQPKASSSIKEVGAERTQELSRLTQMFVLRRTQEINNEYLPPKVELVLFCRASPLQQSLYRHLVHSQFVRHCLATWGSSSGGGGRLAAGSPHLVCIGALRHLCNHPGLVRLKAAEDEMNRREYGGGDHGDSGGPEVETSIYSGLLKYFPSTFDANTVSEQDSGKLLVLSQVLASIWRNSTTEKIVLVSNHTKTLDVLQVFCDVQGYSHVRLDGQTPTAQRQDIVTRFNSKHSPQRIFLLSSKAGGVGLNLIGASRLILYDIDWNPANDLQAMARVWRDGQKGTVHIYRLLTTGTIEEKMYQRQITKQGLSGAVVDLSDKTNVTFSLQDLKDLFSVNETTDCETHSKLACGCTGDPHRESSPNVAGDPCDGADACSDQQPRSCQLGSAGKAGKKSNLTMAELLHWNHWKGQFAKEVESWRLDETDSSLSYVFWQETNAQTVPC